MARLQENAMKIHARRKGPEAARAIGQKHLESYRPPGEKDAEGNELPAGRLHGKRSQYAAQNVSWKKRKAIWDPPMGSLPGEKKPKKEVDDTAEKAANASKEFKKRRYGQTAYIAGGDYKGSDKFGG